jgi:hypothetical protein
LKIAVSLLTLPLLNYSSLTSPFPHRYYYTHSSNNKTAATTTWPAGPSFPRITTSWRRTAQVSRQRRKNFSLSSLQTKVEANLWWKTSGPLEICGLGAAPVNFDWEHFQLGMKAEKDEVDLGIRKEGSDGKDTLYKRIRTIASTVRDYAQKGGMSSFGPALFYGVIETIRKVLDVGDDYSIVDTDFDVMEQVAEARSPPPKRRSLSPEDSGIW